MKTLKQVISANTGCTSPNLMVAYKGRMITTQSEYPKEAYQRHHCNLEWARLNYDFIDMLIYNKYPRIPLVIRNYERVVTAC